jgi:asparagine synthase (glutamine-hydrolysing)
MCGILVLWGVAPLDRTRIEVCLAALKARGPDVTQVEYMSFGANMELAIGFTRLHIQGATGGAEQPFRLADGRLVACNGEIFNSEMLIQTLGLRVPEGASDCAVIPALIEQHGMDLPEVCRQLDGDFAIVVIDPAKGTVSGARDPYGVRPLFTGSHHKDWHYMCSELKGVTPYEPRANVFEEVAPGETIMCTADGSVLSSERWHEVPWLKTPYWRSSLEGLTHAGMALSHSLEEAVAKRLTTVRAIGACLSGGLDSSLVAAIAAKRLGRKGQRLHTYSVGMAGSPDLEHARLVATHINSIHHEKILTPEECLAIIPTVIRAIESFDITTVRASVGNYFVGQLVAETTPDVKVVLNGDGADEVLGGYLYMRAAPDDAAFEAETDRLLREIHRYDVLRSERSMAAHGLESRSPFLDRQFVSVARGLPTEVLRPGVEKIEKAILRTAFAESNILPDKVLWRRKEAFSDGISRAEKSWFEMARDEGVQRAAGDWKKKAETYDVNPPPTAEALWYRELFHDNFPQRAAAVIAPAMWMPRFVKGATDPSARTLSLYTQSATA